MADLCAVIFLMILVLTLGTIVTFRMIYIPPPDYHLLVIHKGLDSLPTLEAEVQSVLNAKKASLVDIKIVPLTTEGHQSIIVSIIYRK